MRILLTNDDGLRAPGIGALHDALIDARGEYGGPLRHGREKTASPVEVVTIAPLTVQSATSHGVTFHQPLMVSEVQVNERMRGVAVDGRPADCVKLALCSLWPERYGDGAGPDLVVSGMNAGANVGINVIYSGTVAAALEAAFLGVPSIAVSLHIGKSTPDWDAAARHARRAMEVVLAEGLPERHTCININVPITESDTPTPPIRVCPMNIHGLNDRYERRVSPAGDVYYWASGDGLDFHGTDEGSDVHVLMHRCVTVTPLLYDLTRRAAIEPWRLRVERAARGRAAAAGADDRQD